MKTFREFLLEGEQKTISPEEITSKSFAKKMFDTSKTKLKTFTTSPSVRVAIPMNTVDEVVLTKKGISVTRNEILKPYISYNLKMGEESAKQSVDQLTDQDILEFWNNIRELMNFRKIDRLEESEVISESDYQVRYSSYSDAVSAAMKWIKKKGFEVSEDDVWNQISIGKSKPKEGETNKFSLEISKDGKVQKKAFQVQITGVKNGYELNMYIL